MEDALVLHFDEKDVVGSHDDILTRRLKNRERQRRYRARKRHEAGTNKPLVVGYPTPLQYKQMPATEFHSVPVHDELSISVPSSDFLTRVYCQRDWKKDARSAHIHKKQQLEFVAPNSSEAATPASGVRSDILSVQSNTPVQDNDGTQGSISARRQWKAETRNKRSSE